MPKLTDTDLVILSAAARRGDGAALPLPKALGIKGEAATRTLDGLRKKGLLDEKPTARKAGAWRESKDGQRMMLVITDSGLKAMLRPPRSCGQVMGTSRVDAAAAAQLRPGDGLQPSGESGRHPRQGRDPGAGSK